MRSSRWWPSAILVQPSSTAAVVEDAAAQAAAQRALGLPRLQLLQDDGVGVLLEHPVLVALGLEPRPRAVAGEAGVPLVEVHRQQREVHRRALLQQPQQVQHGVRVLAAGDGDHHPVAVVDERPVVDGLPRRRSRLFSSLASSFTQVTSGPPPTSADGGRIAHIPGLFARGSTVSIPTGALDVTTPSQVAAVAEALEPCHRARRGRRGRLHAPLPVPPLLRAGGHRHTTSSCSTRWPEGSAPTRWRRASPTRRRPSSSTPRRATCSSSPRRGCGCGGCSTPTARRPCSGWPKVGLADLVKEICGQTLKKEHQQSDFSLRPLPAGDARVHRRRRALPERGGPPGARGVRGGGHPRGGDAGLRSHVRRGDGAARRRRLATAPSCRARGSRPADALLAEHIAQALHRLRLELGRGRRRADGAHALQRRRRAPSPPGARRRCGSCSRLRGRARPLRAPVRRPDAGDAARAGRRRRPRSSRSRSGWRATHAGASARRPCSTGARGSRPSAR